MKYKCEEKFTHLFYLYESWYESSDDRIWRTFSDRFYTGKASHLKRQKKHPILISQHLLEGWMKSAISEFSKAWIFLY